MFGIPALKEVSFKDIEERYIPQAVHFFDPETVAGLGEEDALEQQYKKLLKFPIYQRAEYDDPNCQGVFAARGVGFAGWTLNMSILLSIILDIGECINIDEQEYLVSIFDFTTLDNTFNENLWDVIDLLKKTFCSNVRMEVKEDKNKIMFVLQVDKTADN